MPKHYAVLFILLLCAFPGIALHPIRINY